MEVIIVLGMFVCRRRLEKRIYIPLPLEEGRRELIRINLKDIEVCTTLSKLLLGQLLLQDFRIMYYPDLL